MKLRLCIGIAEMRTEVGSFGSGGLGARSNEEEEDSEDLFSMEIEGGKTILPL